jgi:hypothetical protein
LTGQRAVIEMTTELISKPYIEITLNLMARFGVEVEREGWQRFTIPAGQHYRSPAGCMSKATLRPPRISSPQAPSAAARCGSRVSAAAASRAMCVSPMR